MNDISIQGYELTRYLDWRDSSFIAAGVRLADGGRVTIKSASGTDVQSLRQEYDILSRVEFPAAIRPVEWISQEHCSFLVLREPGFASARDLFRRPLPGERVLNLVRQVAEILHAIHEVGVVHLDIAPENLLIGDGDQVTLTGFTVAQDLSNERSSLKSPVGLSVDLPAGLPVGRPRYMAPEQTGLTAHSVDARADLYCLGGTMYEWLAGEPPFADTEQQALMHAHVARLPRPLGEFGVGATLSAITDKLLAKNPDDRYQSAHQLIADLELCLWRIQRGGSLDRPFTPGGGAGHLRFPEGLYGRTSDLQALRSTLDTSGDELLYVWVAGPSGIGKSALIESATRHADRHADRSTSDRHLWRGKCEQYRRGVPLAVLDQALSPWLLERAHRDPGLAARVAQLAGAALPQLHSAIRALRRIGANPDQLGDGASAAPEDSDIDSAIDSASAHVLSGDAALVASAVRLVTGLVDHEHPLTVFLDDLQWADSATLSWLVALASAPDTSGLTVVGAYRSEELGPMHPLARARAHIAGTQAHVVEVMLAPLSPSAVASFLADTLSLRRARVGAFAREVHRRTHGNPFFMRELCTLLVQDGYLYRSPADGSWCFDVGDIQNAPMPDKLVDFVIAGLRRLPRDVQRIMHHAACIGHQFSTRALINFLKLEARAVGPALAFAAARGLLVAERCSHTRWRFSHDRVHQAAHELGGDKERQQIHLHIGRHLLDLDRRAAPERLFLIVYHLHRASPLLDDEERWQLARLSGRAARESRLAGALAEAESYAQTSRAHLPADAWRRDRAQTFALHLEWALCAHVNGDADSARRHLDALDSATERAHTLVEKLSLAQLRTLVDGLDGRIDDALEHIRAGLALVEIDVPEQPEALRRERDQLDSHLLRWVRQAQVEDALAIPVCTDPDRCALAEFLKAASPPVHTVEPLMHDYIIALQFQLALQRGVSQEFAHTCMAYAYYLATTHGLYREAHRLGAMALAIDEHEPVLEHRSYLSFVLGLIQPFVRPLDEVLASYRQAREIGLRTHDMMSLSYSCSQEVTLWMSRGDNLSDLRETVAEYARLMARTGVVSSRQTQRLNDRLIACYQGHTAALGQLDGDGFHESEFVCQLPRTSFAYLWYVTARMQMLYRASQFDAALAWLESAARPILERTFFYLHCEAIGFAALILAHAQISGQLTDERARWLGELRARLATLAESCPDNFGWLDALVTAEVRSCESGDLAAMADYQRAIELAERNHAPSQAGLSYQCAARYHRRRGARRLYEFHAREAIQCYRRWGAFALVHSVRAQFPELGRVRKRPVTEPEDRPGDALAGEALDIESLLSASQAMAAEVELPRLLERILDIVVLRSGADRCLLVLAIAEDFQLIAAREPDGRVSNWLDIRPSPTDADMPVPLVARALASGQPVVIDDVLSAPPTVCREYFETRRPRSVACLPLRHQARRVGALYLENHVIARAFSDRRVQLLSLISTQIAIALENSLSYERLAVARAVAEAGNRAKNDFLAKVSHELKTPLNGIMGCAHLLQLDAVAQAQPVSEEVTCILDSGEHLLRIIEGVLDFSSLERGDMAFDIDSFDIGLLCTEVIEAASANASGQNLDLVLTVAPEVEQMCGDARRVRKVVHSLVDNAVRFAPAARIDVRVVRRTDRHGGWTHIEVEDRGMGIAAADIERIFDPFEQVDNSSSRKVDGTGLGLSISRRLCCAMGGRLTVTSAPGQGSTFTAILPETTRT